MIAGAALALTLSLHGLSWHNAPGYEAINPGLGLNWRTQGQALHAGAYRNSEARWSTYAGGSVEHCRGRFCGVILLLAFTGYRNTIEIAPLPATSLIISPRWRLNALYIPPVKGITQSIGISLEWRPARD